MMRNLKKLEKNTLENFMTKWTKEYRKEYNKKYNQKNKKVFESKICAECENKFIPIRHNQKTCLNKECQKQYSKGERKKRKKRHKRGGSYLGVNIKKSAKFRNIEAPHAPLEYRNWYIQQIKKCAYCKNDNETIVKYLEKIGEKITVQNNRLHFDRIDSSQGYLLDNLVLACSICNTHKSDIISHDDFIEIAKNYIIPKIKKTLT